MLVFVLKIVGGDLVNKMTEEIASLRERNKHGSGSSRRYIFSIMPEKFGDQDQI